MPQNLCNQDCHFCSYRMSGWKNNAEFSERDRIPWDVMVALLLELKYTGVKGIEVTGGGEPLAYPDRRRLFEVLVQSNFDIGLVSNGTLLNKEFAKEFGPHLTWARISIDAGTVETYRKVRKVPSRHWTQAWEAVAKLRENWGNPDRNRLGVGFVVTNENYKEIPSAVELAGLHGADNIRISVRQGPGGNGYYKPGVLEEAAQLAQECSEWGVQVVDLISERVRNNQAEIQDYPSCPSKDLLCVIGGDSKVYTCCTLAFNPAGLVGDLLKESFSSIWFSEVTRRRMLALDPRQHCKVPCLYEKRNREMIAMLDGPPSSDPPPDHPHKAFI